MQSLFQDLERRIKEEQENASRKRIELENDVKQVRMQIAQSEGQLQEVRATSAQKAELLEADISRLKDQIRALKAARKEEHANLLSEV